MYNTITLKASALFRKLGVYLFLFVSNLNVNHFLIYTCYYKVYNKKCQKNELKIFIPESLIQVG